MSEFTIRARLLDFRRTPEGAQDYDALRYIEDGALVIQGERIAAIGAWGDVEARGELRDFRPHLLMPGFIDLHIHFPQIRAIAGYAPDLLAWLERHTFPEEARFSDADHAKRMAHHFWDLLAHHGTTSCVAFCTSHQASVDAFFGEARARGACAIAGKMMMDRGAPGALLDTPQTGYDESRQGIEKWHGKDRLRYAISPRFAITSSAAQLEAAGALAREHPDCFVQTHINESKAEIARVRELFPEAEDYLAVYERFNLVGERTLLGHMIHNQPREIAALAEHGGVAVHCPTSNLFLGSGLFDWAGLRASGARIGLATDIGGGTSYSMLASMAAAYQIAQLRGAGLSPLMSFYTATRGNAEALGLEGEIGTLDAGSYADLVLLNSRASEAMRLRHEALQSIDDELFLLQTLGDDRAVAKTFIAGREWKAEAGM